MNLKRVYEIFYPGKHCEQISVWDEKPKYRSMKAFYEEAVPMEIQWLNAKVWNDKARRSRFFTDSKLESRYVTAVKEMLMQDPLKIPRLEKKCASLLNGNIEAEAMNMVFFQIIEKEKLELSIGLKKYLIDEISGKLKPEWGNVLAFYIVYAIFPEEVNQLYALYLYRIENGDILSEEVSGREGRDDKSVFQYEYPPDMSVHYPGEMLSHTWIIKNVGKIPWEKRYFECVSPPFPLEEENMQVRLSEIVYLGDCVSVSVSFPVPEQPGAYIMNWKMKDEKGNWLFLDKVGIGLHFTVLERPALRELSDNWEKNNYCVLEEIPAIPVTLIAGKMYSHEWRIQNTGTEVWKEYYCECINGESFRYSKSELRIPLKERVAPGEKISIKIEFVTPPIECNCQLIWKIMKKDGTPAFPEGRQLEVFFNLI